MVLKCVFDCVQGIVQKGIMETIVIKIVRILITVNIVLRYVTVLNESATM